MKVLIAAYYEFMKNTRDLKMIAMLIIFPIISTVILGNSVGKFLSLDSSKRISVGYVNKDTGRIGSEFDKFLNSADIKKRLKIVNFNDKNLCEKAMDNGKIDVLLYLPEDLSKDIQAGNEKAILIHGKKDVEFVESLVNSFTSSINAADSVIAAGGLLKSYNNDSNIKRIYYTKNAKMPKPIDYYAVLTLLEMMILGAVFGMFITARDYGSDMHIRVHSLPVTKWTLICGRILGSTIYLFLASLLIMAFTILVLGVNWNGNIFIILGTLFGFCTIAVGIGVVLGLFFKNFSTGLMLLLLIMMFFSTVSGAISPASTNINLGILSPNYYAKLLIFGTIYGYSKEVMQSAVLGMLSFITIIYGLGAIVVGRRKNDNI